MTFSEVREYQYGDDVRNIDWNVTARLQRPYVKVFEEERELTVMLLVDVSASLDFGSNECFKRDVMTEIAATLAFSAMQNNDKVGVIFFSDKIEKFIPPQKGRKHVLYIIRELLDFKPESTQTDVAFALRHFTNVIKKRCTAFLISDLLDTKPFDDELSIAASKHDLIVLRLYDRREMELPDVGWMKVKDAETGERMWIDTSDRRWRMLYKNLWDEKCLSLQRLQMKAGVDACVVDVSSDDYVKALIGLFKQRGK